MSFILFPIIPSRYKMMNRWKKRQKASGSKVFLCPASSGPAQMEGMRLFRGIGANMLVNWLD